MKLKTCDMGGVTVVTISGRIDANTALELEQEFNAALKSANYRLVADMRSVEFVSSAGLRVFLSTLKEAKRNQGDLRLAGLKNDVVMVFEMTGFINLFTVTKTVKGAVKTFKK